jgi:hypothetical protein
MNPLSLTIDRYISLNTKDELDKDVIRAWYRCVKKNAPPGTIRVVTTMGDKGKHLAVSLIHKITDDLHGYMIPLARDLSEDEVSKIVNAFSEDEPDVDFDVDTHETKLADRDRLSIPLNADKHLALCHAFAKQKHENWMRERSGAGWRYGTSFDSDEKTHPLLMPWDQLPERYKEPDMDWPQKLIHMLNDQGYAVIEKGELSRLLDLLKGP